MQRTRVARLLPMLLGDAANADRPLNLREEAEAFLGLPDAATLDEVLRSDIGLLASSWLRLGSAVWLFDVKNESVIERWFPPSRRASSWTAGSARLFRTHDGLMVCERNGIVAMGRRWGADSLLPLTVRLMAGRAGATLAQSAAFRELMTDLPGGHLAVAYITTSQRVPENDASPLSLWADITNAAFGLYEGKGRLDVEIRALVSKPSPRQQLSPAAIDRLLRLPRTTLLATATTVDFNRAAQAAVDDPSASSVARRLALLAGVLPAKDDSTEQSLPLRSNLIFAWAPDLSQSGVAPRVALLLECSHGRDALVRARQIGLRIIRVVQALAATATTRDGSTFIERTRHLGAPIFHIPLRKLTAGSRVPLLKMLGGIEPAWTLREGWLIIALSPEHIKDILDAQMSLVPTLAAVPDVRALSIRPTPRASLWVIQPDLAADMLVQWLGASDGGIASFLNPAMWLGGKASGSPDPSPSRVERKENAGRGTVTVLGVPTDSAAAGRLQPGDHIIGINGRLLSLAAPSADLTTLWENSLAANGPLLRVLRGDAILDVTIPTIEARRIDPGDAVRELAGLGRALEFASFEVHSNALNPSDATHYSARLSLRLTPSKAFGRSSR